VINTNSPFPSYCRFEVNFLAFFNALVRGEPLNLYDDEIWPQETSNKSLHRDVQKAFRCVESFRRGVDHECDGQADRHTKPALAITPANDPC